MGQTSHSEETIEKYDSFSEPKPMNSLHHSIHAIHVARWHNAGVVFRKE